MGYGDETFHGNYGMLNLQVLRKPAYHAFQLLCMLGTERLHVRTQGDTPLRNVNATRSESGYQAMVYTDQDVDVDVTLPPGAKPGDMTLYQVTAGHNNILRPWTEMGSPVHLRREQLQVLREQNVPKACPASLLTVRPSAQGPCANFKLAGPGVALFNIAKPQTH